MITKETTVFHTSGLVKLYASDGGCVMLSKFSTI